MDEKTSKPIASEAARIVHMQKHELEAYVATDEGFKAMISVAASAWTQAPDRADKKSDEPNGA